MKIWNVGGAVAATSTNTHYSVADGRDMILSGLGREFVRKRQRQECPSGAAFDVIRTE